MVDLGEPLLLHYTEPPPPSYEDVVNPSQEPEGNSQPSAPPPEDVRHISISPVSRPGYDVGQSLDRGRNVQQPASKPSSGMDAMVETYVSFSTAHLLRMNLEPTDAHEDPELDVEAQFSRQAVRGAQAAIVKKKQLQCVSGWLWCIGVIQVLVYLVIPVAMILTGGFGFNSCPFNSRTIIIYLLLGGSMLTLTVVLRAMPSILTCCRNRNFCTTKGSTKSAGCICACETFFYMAFLLNIVVLILGTYWVFSNSPPSSCEATNPDCEFCSTAVYVASACYIVLQYALYLFSAVYLCLVLCCHRCLKNKMQ